MMGIKVSTIKFVRDYKDKWKYVDVLITASPDTLLTKPSEKVSIKVINTYNKNCNSDYTIVDLKEILEDKSMLEKILNTETIEYEDI